MVNARATLLRYPLDPPISRLLAIECMRSTVVEGVLNFQQCGSTLMPSTLPPVVANRPRQTYSIFVFPIHQDGIYFRPVDSSSLSYCDFGSMRVNTLLALLVGGDTA